MVSAVDFETYYDSHHSVSGSHPCTYVQEDEFDPYLVSVVREDGLEYVGHPKNFDWSQIEGDLFIAHNASFDAVVFKRCQELGIIPQFETTWACTADLSRYHQGPRSLKGAAYAFLGEEMDKQIRDVGMKGKHWKDIQAEGIADDVSRYALDDSRLCLRLWQELSAEWPEKERRLSVMSREMGERGVTVDRELLADNMYKLQNTVFNSENDLPWLDEYDAKYKKPFPPQSKRGLNLFCKKAGIAPPTSLAEDAPERLEWERVYGVSYPWVRAMSEHRKANKHLKTLETIHTRIREDGTMPYGLKYGGADTTMRFSGDAGFNTQNMPRGNVMGIDIRSQFIPAPGHKFVISDLSQVEPRCLAWITGDIPMLKALQEGMSPYEFHGRACMGHTGDEPLKSADPEKYILAKARVLSLGYGASWVSFIKQARAFGASSILQGDVDADVRTDFIRYAKKFSPKHLPDLTDPEIAEAANAWRQVMDYREKNPLVVDYWRMLDRALKGSVPQSKGAEFQYELPSGRVMRYMYLRSEGRDVTGLTQHPDSSTFNHRAKLYGSLLTNNACQGMARDIFAEQLLELDTKYKVVLQIHDEVVVEVPEDSAEEARQDIQQIMSRPVSWAKGLPLASEAVITDRYTK